MACAGKSATNIKSVESCILRKARETHMTGQERLIVWHLIGRNGSIFVLIGSQLYRTINYRAQQRVKEMKRPKKAFLVVR